MNLFGHTSGGNYSYVGVFLLCSCDCGLE